MQTLYFSCIFLYFINTLVRFFLASSNQIVNFPENKIIKKLRENKEEMRQDSGNPG